MGFLIDTCIWIDVEQGRLGPADVAAFTGEAPVYLRGRSHRTRVQNRWLASQAIQHSLGLVTRNPGDFADIPGLDVVHIGLPG